MKTALLVTILLATCGCEPRSQAVGIPVYSSEVVLDVRRGAVALTKIDRVSTGRANEVRDDVARLFARTTLLDAPIFPVSAVSGEGIEALKAHLISKAHTCPRRKPSGNFRLAVDRCFTIDGAGSIVTGTAFSGSLAVGETVRMLGAGFTLRARMIHAQNAPSQTGGAGQRCAINLAGAELRPERIERGDWVVGGDVPEPIQKFDARIRLLQSELRPLAHWTPVHVHLGAADVTGRVAILEGPSIAPGASALVQIALDRHIGTLFGDGLILRDQSAQRTIGGGRVIDIFPPVRGRAKPERLAYLNAMENDDATAAFSALVASAARGLNLSRFAQNRNLTEEEALSLYTAASIRTVEVPSGMLGFSPVHWKRLKTAIVESLAVFHRRTPNVIPNEERVFLEAGIRATKELREAVVGELVAEGVLVREPSGMRLSGHVTQLSPAAHPQP